MEVSSMEETLIEERKAQMVSLSPFGEKPSFRIAHFLKPLISPSKPTKTLFNPLSVSLPKKPISPFLKFLSSKVNFHGWKFPMKKWKFWVEKLRLSFESIWKKSSIFEAIMASTVEIPRCRDSIFALGDKWCHESKSFVFAWGEVTITLEDIMVLGGYSVTGDSVFTKFCSRELGDIEENLHMVRLELLRSESKKASQQQWMDIGMKNGTEFEHEAFLCLWLSRYVFPADDSGTMNKSVFPIAILLARGTKFALAPAVLASIYRDLRLLNEKIEGLRDLGDQDYENVTKLTLWAPLQLLQVWFWERFPTFSSKTNTISGLSRLERWKKVKILRIDYLDLALDSAGESFQWRPYSKPLNNKWSFCAKLYPEKARWVSLDSKVGLDLESYVRCIRVSELVGLDCVEQYLPHRVSMQFGLDQDIPIDVPRLNHAREIAWSNYNRQIGDVKLYIPSRFFEPGVTTPYLEWWKKSPVLKGDAQPIAKPCQGSSKTSMTVAERLRIKIENNEADVPPGFNPKGKRVATKASDDSSDQPSSKSCKRSEVEAEDCSDDDDDHQTLTQLFGLKGSFSQSRQESPLSSAGENDNASMQDMKLTRSASEAAASPIRFSMSTDKKELDLLGRIARLQRIVDMVKEAKMKCT